MHFFRGPENNPRSNGPDKNPLSIGPDENSLSIGREQGIRAEFPIKGRHKLKDPNRLMGIGCKGIEAKEVELSKAAARLMVLQTQGSMKAVESGLMSRARSHIAKGVA
ncbi:hypothetical protein OIU78_002860 [Salix suchowensis]|nr:hypothetical protein OIU78_002860 [Salix suchowensis]